MWIFSVMPFSQCGCSSLNVQCRCSCLNVQCGFLVLCPFLCGCSYFERSVWIFRFMPFSQCGFSVFCHSLTLLYHSLRVDTQLHATFSAWISSLIHFLSVDFQFNPFPQCQFPVLYHFLRVDTQLHATFSAWIFNIIPFSLNLTSSSTVTPG